MDARAERARALLLQQGPFTHLKPILLDCHPEPLGLLEGDETAALPRRVGAEAAHSHHAHADRRTQRSLHELADERFRPRWKAAIPGEHQLKLEAVRSELNHPISSWIDTETQTERVVDHRLKHLRADLAPFTQQQEGGHPNNVEAQGWGGAATGARAQQSTAVAELVANER